MKGITILYLFESTLWISLDDLRVAIFLVKPQCLFLYSISNSNVSRRTYIVFSRFDDETGEIHNPRIDRNALRHLFTKKTERERLEKQQRETILQASYT